MKARYKISLGVSAGVVASMFALQAIMSWKARTWMNEGVEVASFYRVLWLIVLVWKHNWAFLAPVIVSASLLVAWMKSMSSDHNQT